MPWYAWALIGWILFGSVVTVATIDRPRKPLGHDTAIVTLIFHALFIWAIVSLSS